MGREHKESSKTIKQQSEGEKEREGERERDGKIWLMNRGKKKISHKT